jgi:hypothetical protein
VFVKIAWDMYVPGGKAFSEDAGKKRRLLLERME